MSSGCRYRNAEKRAEARARDLERRQNVAMYRALGLPREVAGAVAPAAARRLMPGEGLLLAPGVSPRDAWVAWLAPVFSDCDALYFTGTYSDEYGLAHGLMLQRNVFKDFERFLESFEYEGRYIIGVERHQYRDILHLHAILEGPFTAKQMRWVKDWWSAERGHARALPVLDGCASYVTKYALKGDTDFFGFRLS